MKITLGLWTATLSLAATSSSAQEQEQYFQRVATFTVCTQLEPNCNTDTKTNAESLAFFDDGKGLVYADNAQGKLGFVNVADPSAPVGDGAVDVGGEPTSVRVVGGWAVAGVVDDTSTYAAPAGALVVVDLVTKAVVRRIDLGGQPDAVDVTKPGSDFPWYIAVAIENEHDEDVVPMMPQIPPGKVTIVAIASEEDLDQPNSWTVSDVDVTGRANCRWPEDPEPEYVAIDAANEKAIVTFQENNCIVVVDLATASVSDHFNAGGVALSGVDLTKDWVISQDETMTAKKRREPDGITWLDNSPGFFATANEGEWQGTRGWSIFNVTANLPTADENVIYDSGNDMELEAARIGHYPEVRSGKKGNEPSDILYAMVEDTPMVFVASERGSVVFVYDVTNPATPDLRQTLPAGMGPEGPAYDAKTGVLAVACEVDHRSYGKARSSIALYTLAPSDKPAYPTLVSGPREGAGPDGPFIPFSALSGLTAAAPLGAASPALADPDVLYAVENGRYKKTRILTINASAHPAVITEEARITDADAVLLDCNRLDLVNGDKTVNLDAKGIAASVDGGFWIVAHPNLLLKVDDDAVITECIRFRTGIPHGVAEDGNRVVIAMQRASGTDELPRLILYNKVSKMFKHGFYPLEAPRSQYGGWVGLADIAPAGPGKFYVLEGDNQAGFDAAIKTICVIDLDDYSFSAGTVFEKELHRDLIPDLLSSNGQVFEKVEGLAVTACGKVWINNNNKAVDFNSGEQALLHVDTVANSCEGGNSCANRSECVNVKKCVKKPNKCKCLDNTCKKKRRDCNIGWTNSWNCGDGKECTVKQEGNKWGKCRPTASPTPGPTALPTPSPTQVASGRGPTALPTPSPVAS